MKELKSDIINTALYFIDYRKSSYLFDLRQILLNNKHLIKISYALWNRIEKLNPDILIGYGMGSSLLVGPISVAAHLNGRNISTLIVRNERRISNTQILIEGEKPTKKQKTAVFIDDSINSGSTLYKCQEILAAEGYNIKLIGVATILDLWGAYGSRRLETLGIPIIKLFTRHDLGLSRASWNTKPFDAKILWHAYNINREIYSPYMISSPTIYKDNIFLGTNKSEIYCLDLLTGDIFWKKESKKPHIKGIAASIIPINHTLIISNYNGTVSKLDVNGNLLWEKKVDSTLHSTPIYNSENNMIYLGTEWFDNKGQGDIVALDFETGNEVWRSKTLDYVPCSPNIHEDEDFTSIICCSNDCHIYALDAENGELLAKNNTSGEVKGFIEIIDDLIITGSNTGFLQIWNPSCELLFEKQLGYSLFHCKPLIYKDLIIIGNSTGLIFGFNYKTFKIEWINQVHGSVTYNLTLMNDKLFVASTTGTWAILDNQTGKKLSYSRNMPELKQPASWDSKNNILVIPTNTQGLIACQLPLD